MKHSFYIWVLIGALASACGAKKPFYQKSVLDWEEKAPPASLQADFSLFLIGDAGKPAEEQTEPTFVVLKEALEIAGDNSAVVFLGDNIYPVGLPDEDDKGRKEAERRITEQLKTVKDYEGRAVFIPGNHDWAQGAKRGLKHVREQEKFVEKYLDNHDAFLPGGGCPGPEEIALTDDLTLVIIDSQWWLHKYEKPDDQYDCIVKYNMDFLVQLEDVLKRNKDKMVVVCAHHPLYSYGNHGGYYSVKQHIFPLTMAKSNLYVPIPVLGSVGPLIRKFWGNIQDIPHPRYQELKDGLTEIFRKYPNTVYAAGHEHNLQYIPVDSVHYIVSGAGSKQKYVKKGKKAHFTYDHKGFARLDYYSNGECWLSFLQPEEDGKAGKVVYREKLFTYQPNDHTSAEPPEIPPGKTMYHPGFPQFKKKGFGAWLLGDNYRKEWLSGSDWPLLDLRTEAGGLTIVKKGGGHQTKSLRLEDPEGRQYVLRTIEKYPEAAVPDILRNTFVTDIFEDMISASYPYGAIIIPKLADAAQIYHTQPRLVILPDGPHLGEYQEEYGDKLFLFEDRPAGNREDQESFGRSEKLISTLKTLDKTMEDNDHRVDQQWTLRSRLFDLWIGDWDRHDDQWRFGKFDTDGAKMYRPVPRDRDQAFFCATGPLPRLLLKPWAVKGISNFEATPRNITNLAYTARYFDRSFLSSRSLEDWLSTADTLKQRLTDDIIDAALRDLPEEIGHHSASKIRQKLISRREQLPEMAAELYGFLSRSVDVQGSDKQELFEVVRKENGETVVTVHKRSKKGKIKDLMYHRVFYPDQTREIRLYGHGGDDIFQLSGQAKKGIRIRIIGGKGDDLIEDNSKVSGLSRKTIVYDKKGNTEIKAASESRIRLSLHKDINAYDRYAPVYPYTGPAFSFGFNVDDGIFIGGGARFIRHGFRKLPYKFRQKIQGNIAFGTGAWNFKYDGHFVRAIKRWDITLEGEINAPNYVNNFFGLGNDTPNTAEDDLNYNRVRLSQGRFFAGIGKSFLNDIATVALGPIFEYTEVQRTPGRFIDDLQANGLDPVEAFSSRYFTGGKFLFNYDTRINKVMPVRGMNFNFSAANLIGLGPYDGNFSSLASDLSFYFSIKFPVLTTVAARVGGASNMGDFPFFMASTLGGWTNLRGYRRTRFSGRSSFYQNIDLRIKLGHFQSIILPADWGIYGFNDFGRVWTEGSTSTTLHHGYGGGIWLAPFSQAVLTASYGHSDDGGLFFFRLGWFF